MFVRVKNRPKSPRKSVQIVKSYRIDGKFNQPQVFLLVGYLILKLK